ncbi:nuclear nucleic acid-binding protein C1D [Punica granatum]|uniref:Nuclear nucleic acid-binding protein C1D n=2 Tax=Punica granatum TaxID=22663 RepID=A0A218XQ59_PUNGR|nr:nuclear nucleic acid-binding protein C1D [Punica granatum]OWM86809.1 hypothetical protein CDL15_Pgr015845 [Punica granatum]PKI33996.1 hypothetical protein CRG98_045614 [Punica granatum]
MEVESGDSIVPENVMDSVNRTSADLQRLSSSFPEFLSLTDPDVLTQVHPLQRAQAMLVLAKSATTLLALRLRCTGVNPADHPIKSELERISLYEAKLERLMDLDKAPLRPSTTLNSQAANRFIERSLPHLTPDQRQSMRDVSRREKMRNMPTQRKRKYQSPEKPSVQAATKEFLEKAARELLGDNKGSLKGPLVEISSDDD